MAVDASLEPFVAKVRAEGERLYRDLPWRRTRDPYEIWVSEAMLQQTQVTRVDGRWQRWIARFPSVGALAAADQADVLAEWQGLGYNRRALALKRAAETIAEEHDGQVPSDTAALVALPGIGPATAAGVRAFAFDLPAVYLETNVRTVFLHELFPDAEDVPDSAVRPLVEACVPDRDVRGWYYALLDYGVWLKKTVPNPSRRSRTHARQSRFEGSRRQKRAALVRLLLEAREAGLPGLSLDDAASSLASQELAARRPAPSFADVEGLLDELTAEGFCQRTGMFWTC